MEVTIRVSVTRVVVLFPQLFITISIDPTEGRVQIVGRNGRLGGPLPHHVSGVREATNEVSIHEERVAKLN